MGAPTLEEFTVEERKVLEAVLKQRAEQGMVMTMDALLKEYYEKYKHHESHTTH